MFSISKHNKYESFINHVNTDDDSQYESDDPVSSIVQTIYDVPECDDLDNPLLIDGSDSNITEESQLTVSNNLSESVSFPFASKGLHICNLNIRHVLPKINDIRLLLSNDKCPDIMGVCETYLQNQHPDSLLSINNYSFIRKDRSETQDKSGGGLLIYFRESLNIKRRHDLEISNIETIWTEISLTNSKSFLLCTVYQSPSACSDWIDLFEAEVSIAQASGLEFLLMGDFNIDLESCTNSKWLNLIQLFDLSQLVKEPTRVTETTSTIIDHAYTTNLEKITECFVSPLSVSDHFPICLTRKINSKVSKFQHTTRQYRCFKRFDEISFLNDLQHDLNTFEIDRRTVDEDLTDLHSIIIKNLDKHPPIKARRVKSIQLPEWYTSEIGQARIARDKYKRLKQWTEYKRLRNKTRNLKVLNVSILLLPLKI